MKHSLQLRLSQHLTLTPQLQQSIKLLQLSTLELNQELERFLQDNPMLERDDGSNEDLPPVMIGTTPTATTSTESSHAEQEAPADAPLDAPQNEFSSLDDGSYGGSRDNGDDDNDYPQVAAVAPTLRDHLISQVSLTKLSERDAERWQAIATGRRLQLSHDFITQGWLDAPQRPGGRLLEIKNLGAAGNGECCFRGISDTDQKLSHARG